jgi:hypothetical protein
MAKARSQKQRNWRLSGVLLTVATIALAVAYYSFRHGRVGTGFQTLALATFLLFVFFAFTKPTRCGVIGKSTKRPCPNFGHGYLIGCHIHTWDKLHRRARAGESFPPASARPGSGVVVHHVQGPVAVSISPEGRSRFDVFMSVATLAVAVVSALAAVLSIH